MECIDFHAHLHPTEEALKRLISKMDSLGITQTVVVAGGLVTPEMLSRQIGENRGSNVNAPNGAVLRLSEQSAKRLIPFYFANPHGTSEEYRRWGKEFKGLKLAPAVHGIALTDPRHIPFFILAAHFKHPVYLHCLQRPGFDVDALVDVARRFSRIQFVLGHAGIGQCDFSAVDKVKDSSNIHFEMSGGMSGVVTYALETLGEERLIFGSEYPLQEPLIELTKAKSIDLNFEVLNRNAKRLLGVVE